MSTSRTTRIFTLGTQGSRHAWTAMAQRSRFEQILAMILGVFIVIPLLLLFLGVGTVVAVLALVTGAILAAAARIRRLMNRAPREPVRENVRVVGPDRGR